MIAVRVWAPAAAAGAAIGALTTEQPADVSLFARAGQDVLTGHFAGVYGGTVNQAGPLQALLSRLLVASSDGSGPARLVLVAVDAALLVLVAVLAHRAGGAARAAVAGGYAALWLAAPAFWGGHPLEVLIPVLWLVAARYEGRAGALALAGAAAVAPWGVLGWPVILRRRAGRRSISTVAQAGVLTAAVYAPLLLAGHGSAARHVWPVERRTLLHLLFPHLAHFGWDLRLVQAGFVILLLAAVAWRLPASPARAPLLVTVAALLRLVSDPLSYAYYWLPAGVGALALLVTVPRLRGRPGLAVLGVAYVAWAAAALHAGAAAPAALALLVVGFGTAGFGAVARPNRYSRQMRSSSARNRAAGSAVRGPSR